ncbi:DNA/RNA non-specific endonuclease [Limosilactobacillus sp. RRLNB_1_1]|uniref:DNA/RNA non-specific endonuclease n=1 Tax=Limosilactobacillus albertensis TaxID=2759752 RepID=A0A7W3TRL3_9LACO|nr:DNA/RNA non-specific endonuclease [Limosilactobacillus albertensis]MBB1069620.1 DNA/RNA non-specific endonuclease [Limosilactobacillus albertensis]MCD7118181.1 DNA/RNA non-specific endonuclease [Limosilactobacillus albertensis]MCD7127995.1 DNA/RNA non-specific endonuclease [Limosilactobacillus albertensis]
MRFRFNKKTKYLILALVALFGIGSFTQQPEKGSASPQGIQRLVSWRHNSNGNRSSTLTPPTQSQATSVLSDGVRQQLGTSNIKWNGYGAFILNNNQTNLNASINNAPYAVNRRDSRGRAWQGDAWLNRTTRQYRNRNETGNGATNWKPVGFLQAHNLKGGISHAYDRGHLLGYALVGGIRGFDASESNPANIATQTAWANEARSSSSTGQNYYEGLVRKALDQNKQVRYRVTDIYDGNNLVPSGAHIEAKSKDGSLQYNVFVPNVQNNISINYATGAVTAIDR